MPSEEQTYRRSIEDKLTALQKTGDATLAQATKTNGRVTALEQAQVQQNIAAQVFRARVTTAIGLLAFIVGSMVIPIVGSFIQAGRF